MDNDELKIIKEEELKNTKRTVSLNIIIAIGFIFVYIFCSLSRSRTVRIWGNYFGSGYGKKLCGSFGSEPDPVFAVEGC